MATILQFCTSIAASRVDSFVYSAMIATRVQSNSQNSSFSSLKLGVQFIHNLQRQAKLLVISTTVLFSDFDEERFPVQAKKVELLKQEWHERDIVKGFQGDRLNQLNLEYP